MKVEVLLLPLLLSMVRASLLQGIDHGDHGHHHAHHHDDHTHHHDDHVHHHDDHTHHHDDHTHHHDDHALHHDDHAHHHDFPLAIGEETALASVRISELFSALTHDDQPLPRDMLIMNEVPTNVQFSCADRLQGYYADVDYNCQVYHICRSDHPMASFLCPSSTVFNQRLFTCDWWFNVNCSLSPSFYSLNSDLYKKVEEQQVVLKQERQLNSNIQAKSTLHNSEATSDFSSVLQGLSLPDETPDGSEKIEALVLPHTPQFIIPVPPSTQVIQKNLNQLASDYLPPTNEYLPPTNEYLPPKKDYLPPTNEYLPPKNDYLPPTNDYLPPTNEYLPPTNDYLPPTNEYLPPANDYLPPTNEYLPPSF